MRMGIHTETLAHSLSDADIAIIYQPQELGWNLNTLTQYADNIEICISLEQIIARVKAETEADSHCVLMSNGSFGGIYQRLQDELADRKDA